MRGIVSISLFILRLYTRKYICGVKLLVTAGIPMSQTRMSRTTKHWHAAILEE